MMRQTLLTRLARVWRFLCRVFGTPPPTPEERENSARVYDTEDVW